MLPIPLPWLIVGVLVSLFGSYRVGHHYGWLERDNDMKIAIAQKNDEARATEQKLNEQLNANATKLQETTNVINQKQSALNLAIRSGRVRISAPSCVQASASTPAPAGDTETRAELDGRVAQALVDLTSRGDQAIRSLNACIDTYEKVRSMK